MLLKRLAFVFSKKISWLSGTVKDNPSFHLAKNKKISRWKTSLPSTPDPDNQMGRPLHFIVKIGKCYFATCLFYTACNLAIFITYSKKRKVKKVSFQFVLLFIWTYVMGFTPLRRKVYLLETDSF